MARPGEPGDHLINCGFNKILSQHHTAQFVWSRKRQPKQIDVCGGEGSTARASVGPNVDLIWVALDPTWEHRDPKAFQSWISIYTILYLRNTSCLWRIRCPTQWFICAHYQSGQNASVANSGARLGFAVDWWTWNSLTFQGWLFQSIGLDTRRVPSGRDGYDN